VHKKKPIPVVNTFMGKGAASAMMSIACSRWACSPKRPHHPPRLLIADVVDTVGYDSSNTSPSFWNENQDKAIVHIDFLLSRSG
jgi:thiamine pyrophosphate-dependent acetolactate synthase large subunit-like protein